MNIDEQSASPELFINIHVIQRDSSSSRLQLTHPPLTHTGGKLFYSISASYHSLIVFYTVDSVMVSKRKITSFFKSETEGKDKQPKTRVLVTMSRFPGE